jgi:hypothetical protein
LGVSALFISGLVASGCGGDSASPAPASDAGHETGAQDTAAPPQDTGPETATDASTCTIDADLNQINPPDAGLEGGTSVGICLGCIKTACSSQLSDCNKDCECNNLIVGALQCYEAGGKIETCAGGVAGADNVAQQLGACLYLSCRQDCAQTADAGAKDGGADAPDAD